MVSIVLGQFILYLQTSALWHINVCMYPKISYTSRFIEMILVPYRTESTTFKSLQLLSPCIELHTAVLQKLWHYECKNICHSNKAPKFETITESFTHPFRSKALIYLRLNTTIVCCLETFNNKLSCCFVFHR